MPTSRLNLAVLALCQALAMTSMTMVMTTIALIGVEIAPVSGLATLPLALQLAVTMATAIPASLFMRRFGRRVGFSLGAAVGVVSAAVSAYAIYLGSFALFSVSAAAYGVTQSFAGFYRFAAVETAPRERRAEAASLVLAGGVVAGLVGPTLAVLSRTLVEGSLFSGTFLAIAALSALALAVIQALRIPPSPEAERGAGTATVGALLARPLFLLAVASASIGYASMSLLMTATPLAMAEHRHSFPATAFVIQWHVVGMYAPSFVTGLLIGRWGVLTVILVGAATILGAVAIDQSGTSLAQFWTALVLLGIGWNFMYVGGTTLLAEAHGPAERAKAQALNEFVMFAFITAASLGSGLLQQTVGWVWVNLAVVPGLLAIAAATLWLRPRGRAAAA
ncbi:MAG TPA: MFS transporter [Alphaproteobacteria bacterium]|nr:MFS transporter [Alphaproteobacteria bacterium]